MLLVEPAMNRKKEEQMSLDFYRNLERREVNVGGIPIRYRRAGRGPAVVFVHGWPLSAATYRAAARALSESHTCYLPDLPGAGDTPWTPCELFSKGAELIAGFADALDSSSYALVGHDSGGAMARLVAAAHGPRVKALILSNTEAPSHCPAMVLRLQKIAGLPGAQAMFKQLLKSRSYCRSSQGFGGCFANLDLLDAGGEFHDAFVKPLIHDPSGAFASLRGADLHGAAQLIAEAHPRITAPTHFVWGARDPFFPPSLLPELTGPIPDAREPVIIDDAKLLVHEEHPEVFAETCRQALHEAFAARPAAALA